MSGRWRWRAAARWPGALWIDGNGPFASVSHCSPGVTVVLCRTLEGAERAKVAIDRRGCGGMCSRRHELFVLGPPDVPAPVEATAGGAS